MNPNLTPTQRAARNLFAAHSGITDPALIELAFLDPQMVKATNSMLAGAFDGPFGSFDNVVTGSDERVVQSPNHELGYREGIGHALMVLTRYQTVAPSREAAEFFVAEVQKIIGTIESFIADDDQMDLPLEPATEAKDELEGDILTALFSGLFGRPVKVYQV